MVSRTEVLRRINELQRQGKSLGDAAAEALREFRLKRIPPRAAADQRARGPGRTAAGSRRHDRVSISPVDYSATFEQVFRQAKMDGFEGDADALRPIFDQKVAEAVTLLEDLAADQHQYGLKLLRAIADLGGIGDDPMFPREIQQLWDRSDCQTPLTHQRDAQERRARRRSCRRACPTSERS